MFAGYAVARGLQVHRDREIPMHKQKKVTFVLSAITALYAPGCGKRAEPPKIDAAHLKLFAPLPKVVAAKMGAPTEAQIALGRMLFYDPRLSRSQTVSCNTCHDLGKYGVDGQATSEGYKGQHGDRNSPTVYNAAGHIAQFWDGRAVDVEAQAKGPVLNPVEMAMPSGGRVVAVLKSMPGYVSAFRTAFPEDRDPVTFDNMAKAVGAFERGLVTPARWDRFLAGDEAALTAEEKAGFLAFTAAGCQNCHAGAWVGGNSFQKLGVAKPYHDMEDPGRYKVTKSEVDRMVFKVASLRNVEKTGPYFHSGKVPTLEQAVAQMGDYQLGKQLSEAEIQSITRWLKCLTGEIPAEYIRAPELPKSTARTPKAQLTD
jgi:cytochrome c peroxidase